MYPDPNDLPTPDENRLDEALRGTFADFELPPDDRVWAGVAAGIAPLPPPRLAPRRRRRTWLLPLVLLLTAFVGGLGGWLLPRPAAVRQQTAALQSSEHTSGKGAALLQGSQSSSGRGAAPLQGSRSYSGRGAALLQGSRSYSGRGATLLQGSRSYSGKGAALLQGSRSSSGKGAALLQGRGLDSAPVFAGGDALPPTGQAAGAAVPGPSAATPDTAHALPAISYQPSAKADAPPTLAVLIALEHRTLDQLPALPAPDTAARRALARTLRAERHELLHLQRRTDSLLLALGEVLPAAPALPIAQTDTTEQETSNQKPETKKWSLLLTAAPEQNYLGLASALRDEATNLRRNQETGRFGLAAALSAEYQASHRLSLGAGLGYTRVGTELRQALRTTDYRVRYDTTITRTATGYTTVSSTYSIRVVQLPQLSPVFNASGQVVRYDTVFVPRNDTLRSTVISHDTIRTTRRVITPLLQRYENTTYQTLRPDYHFLTLPVLVRYRLGQPGRARLWADVSAGAQLQFFLGGSQLVSTDGGATFRTERVGVADGPFRAFNLALSTAVALNYALTDRLSLSLAPTLRWQTLSVFRPETGLRQQATSTGLQVGLRFKL